MVDEIVKIDEIVSIDLTNPNATQDGEQWNLQICDIPTLLHIIGFFKGQVSGLGLAGTVQVSRDVSDAFQFLLFHDNANGKSQSMKFVHEQIIQLIDDMESYLDV